MSILQAYVDDSASDSGDKRFFLAGYINSAPAWEVFSDLWKGALSKEPAIAYFKMTEAHSLRGEFKGWSEADRNGKVVLLANIIRRFEHRFIFCSVSRKEYREILAPVSPMGLKGPYFACFQGIMGLTARHHADLHLPNEPVDFIFDEQGGLGDEALITYRWLKETEEPQFRHLLGATPIFCDDKITVALQASDLLAWYVRRDHESGLEDTTVFDLLTHRGLGFHIEKRTLEGLAKKMSRVPGVKRIQTKPAWRKTKKDMKAYEAAGAPPPSTNPIWMHYVAFRAWVERTVHWWRYLR